MIAPYLSFVGNPNDNFWLYNVESGYDLTHPSLNTYSVLGIKLDTTTVLVFIDPDKTALVIIDMQNFFLGMGSERGEGHDVEDVLLSFGIPAAQEVGI